MRKYLVTLVILAILSINFYATVCNETVKSLIMNSMTKASRKDKFKAFHYLYERPYELNSEEGLIRFRVFKQNLKFIEDSNGKNLGFTLEINQFTDLTKEEFRNGYLTYENDIEADKNNEISEEEFDGQLLDYEEIDHSKYLSIPRDQKNCGSCWAFASLGAIEANIRISSGKNCDLSRQNLVDCDPDDNCKGGKPLKVWSFIKTNGVAHDSQYPYFSGRSGTSGVCKKDIPTNKILKGFEFGSRKREIFELLKKGPIHVGVDGSSKEFIFYKSGILEPECIKINHAVILYGFGISGTKAYYKIQNSYGIGYGEKGRVNIAVNTKNFSCFIETSGIYPIVAPEGLLPTPKPAESCLKMFSDCNFKGKSQEIFNTALNFSIKESLSIDLGRFVESNIYFYSSEGCAGEKLPFYDNQKCLTKPIKSVVFDSDEEYPQPGCIWIYDEPCLTGNRRTICEQTTKLTDFKLASIKLRKNSVAMLKLYKANLAAALSIEETQYRLNDSLFKVVDKIKLIPYPSSSQ